MIGKKEIRSLISALILKIRGTHVYTFAAAAVYHIFIAMAPALMLLVSLIRFLPVTQEEVLRVFSGTISKQAFDFINSLASSIFNSNETITLISSILLLVAASGSVRALMEGLDEAYGLKRRQPSVVFAAWAVIYTLLFLVMIVLSLAMLVYGSDLLAYLQSIPSVSSLAKAIISIVEKFRYLLWILILIPIFMYLYDALPTGKRKIKEQFPGAVFSALAWAVFSWGYSIYVSVSDKFGAYGYLGTIMVVMMWIYYCMLFFMLGGCLNACLQDMRQQDTRQQDTKQQDTKQQNTKRRNKKKRNTKKQKNKKM